MLCGMTPMDGEGKAPSTTETQLLSTACSMAAPLMAFRFGAFLLHGEIGTLSPSGLSDSTMEFFVSFLAPECCIP